MEECLWFGQESGAFSLVGYYSDFCPMLLGRKLQECLERSLFRPNFAVSEDKNDNKEHKITT
jgi:hypothetical protein